MLMQLTGFSPDLAPTTDGVITDCDNMLPTLRGIKAAPAPISAGLTALSSEVRGLFIARRLDGTWRVFAPIDSAIFEVQSSAWVDQSKTGGYPSDAENRWRFCQFGNTTIATKAGVTIQKSLAGTFSDISSAPSAAIVETASGFVLAFDTNDGTYGTRPDGWSCCALRNPDDWVPAIATQAANGRLLDSPGAVRAARRLGPDVVAYKERSMYIGRYQGPPVIWSWTLIPGEIGALSHESVIDIGTAHIFPGYEDFYLFDGTRPVPIGSPVREWFLRTLDPKYRHRIVGVHDRIGARVIWFFPDKASSGARNTWLAYNYKTQQWGKGTLRVDAVGEYLSGGITFDNYDSTIGGAFDSAPNIPFDSPFWISESAALAIVDDAHRIMTLTGGSSGMSITTGDIGGDEQFYTLQRVRPRFLLQPTSGMMTHYTKSGTGSALSTAGSSSLNDGKFDALWSDRWHRVQMVLTGDVELSAIDITITQDGTQ